MAFGGNSINETNVVAIVPFRLTLRVDEQRDKQEWLKDSTIYSAYHFLAYGISRQKTNRGISVNSSIWIILNVQIYTYEKLLYLGISHIITLHDIKPVRGGNIDKIMRSVYISKRVKKRVQIWFVDENAVKRKNQNAHLTVFKA